MAYTPDSHLSFNLPHTADAHLTFGAADAPVSAVGTCTIAIRLPALQVSVSLSYDNDVSRGLASEILQPSQAAVQLWVESSDELRTNFEVVAKFSERVSVSSPVIATVSVVVGRMARLRREAVNRVQAATHGGFDVRESLQGASRHAIYGAAGWQSGLCRSSEVALSWQAMYRYQINSITRSRQAQRRTAQRSTVTHSGRTLTRALTDRWQYAWSPRPGKSWSDPGIEPPKPDGCYVRSAHITFKWPTATDGHLTFICDNALAPGEPKRIIPIRSAYIVINHVTLIRVDTGRELVCEALDISVDADSWTCAWSATLAWSEFDALRAERGQPVELMAAINGHSYKLLMEGAPARQRSFGKWGVSIRGRGIAAALDSPHQDVSVRSNPTQAMTAQQLMADALTINGVSNGWAIDWQIDDWLVLAGAWSHQGTPIAAVLEVAGAVGAIVQAADAAKTLRILHRYPIKPWEWATANPDIQIPLDIVTTDAIEPLIKPGYNAVYVGGQTHGITALVKRQGTAGDLLAPTITHPILTAAEATRQRGIAILGDTGAQERISMSLPLSDDTGLIRLNMLADVPDPDDPWRGLVRSVALSAKWQGQGGLEVWQNISLERRYDN